MVAALLPGHVQLVDVPRGHPVFAEGDRGDRLYIIFSGRVKIGQQSPHGQQRLLAFLGRADMFGEVALFDPGPQTSSGITVTAARAVSMDQTALRSWISERPEVTEQLLRVLGAGSAAPTTTSPT